MPINRLKEFLDTNNVKYITISHSRAFTAKETATSAHITRKELAKTVMVKIDGKNGYGCSSGFLQCRS